MIDKSKISKRHGSAKEHGRAHECEHKSWSRRDFLNITGLTAAGTTLLLGGWPITATRANPLIAGLSQGNPDRVLVLIRLNGGNDGLNTVIHRDNDEYYNIRPTLAIQEPNLWALSDEFGMSNEMIDLQPMWEEGKMKVIHNVGYPKANYSHFRSSDIWATASDSKEVLDTGWIGRFMDTEFPDFLETPPVVPPAIEIGVRTNLIFKGSDANLALSINNPTEFYQIALNGQLYDTNILGNCPNDVELLFLRQTANAAFRYSESIQEAYNNGANEASYPDNNLAEQLAIVARLIKGNLGTKVYMVSISGFDTHSNQANRHPELMNDIATSVNAFYEDLQKDQSDERVLGMSFSEFGRTIFENGSEGTDHGTGGPVLLFGEGIGQGFVGEAPDLINVDNHGDPFFSVDFRSIYATILQDWLGVDNELVNHTIGKNMDRIDDLVPAIVPPVGSNGLVVLLGHNPDFENPGVIQIKYSLLQRANIQLQITDLAGHPLRTLIDEFKEKGSYIYSLKPAKYHIPPGDYIYRLSAGGRVFSRGITI